MLPGERFSYIEAVRNSVVMPNNVLYQQISFCNQTARRLIANSVATVLQQLVVTAGYTMAAADWE